MISIITPSHNPQWLDQCYESLKDQTYEDWEWIVVLNGGVKWNKPVDEPRVKVKRFKESGNIGALKNFASKSAKGDWIVELDHDDLLLPDALEQLSNVDNRYSMVFSDCVDMTEDGNIQQPWFDRQYGWLYGVKDVNDQQLIGPYTFEPLPHNISYIWYAPNHFRAFNTKIYKEIGGHADLPYLDDQELMSRLYQKGPFYHIDEFLYVQRVHSNSAQRDPETNANIQIRTKELYDQHIQANALAWAKREGLWCLDLGAAHNKPEGYTGIDLYGSDLNGDVIEIFKGMDDSSVGVIRAVDFLEHIPDKIEIFNEMYRVLAHGGMLLSLTPSTDGRGAWQDPTHVAFYNENTFWYFTDHEYAKFVPEIKCKFQVSKMGTLFPTDWHQQHNISYVNANLVAIKDGPRIAGIKNWP